MQCHPLADGEANLMNEMAQTYNKNAARYGPAATLATGMSY
jgi:hypothetical protein